MDPVSKISQILESDDSNPKAKEVLKAPGFDSIKSAEHGAKKAKKPEDEPKHSSKKVSHTHSEETELSPEELEIIEKKMAEIEKKEKGDEEDEDKGKADKGDDKKKPFWLFKKKNKNMKEDTSEDVSDISFEPIKVDVTEHVDALFNGEDLSEDFKNKAKTIFEAAIQDRENALREQIIEEYEGVVNDVLETAQENLAEQVDLYMNHLTESWMEENKVEVENGIKLELAESLLNGLRTLFADHNISVPETEVDIVSEMNNKINELSERLNEAINDNIELTNKLEMHEKQEIVDDVCEGLTETQKEKLMSLVEDLDFSNNESFKKKVNIIKENYFVKSNTKPNIKSSADIGDSMEDISHVSNKEPEVIVEDRDLAEVLKFGAKFKRN